MSGKQAKKERKAQREAERRAAAQAERRRTIFTVVVVLVVLALGSALAFVSVDDSEPLAEQGEDKQAEKKDASENSDDSEEAEKSSEEPADKADVAACEPAPPPEKAGEEKSTYDKPEQVLDPAQHNKAVITTSCGEITLDLDHERAPEAVNSFVFLAQQGFFDGLKIFRHAESIGALQTGAGDNQAGWKIGYTLDDELQAAKEEGYPPGSVAMANSGPDTSGSQFFFVYNDSFTLDPTYTRFAMVTEGLEVLQSIAAIPTDGETPTKDVYIEQVTISP